MNKHKNTKKIARIQRERGRIPAVSTVGIAYQEVIHKSQAGVEYTHYQPVNFKK